MTRGAHARAQSAHDIHDAQRSAFRALVVSRLLLATLFLAASLLIRGEHYTFYLSIGVFFLVTALSIVRVRRPSVAHLLSIGQIAADLVVITGLSAFTHKGAELVVFLYLVPIVSASLLFRRVGGLLVAGLSGAAYSGGVLVGYALRSAQDRPYNWMQSACAAGMTFAVFVAVGILVRQLVENMYRHGRELSRLRSLHHAILDNMNSGLVTTDADNRVIYANPTAEAILGRPARDMIGRHIGTFFTTRNTDGTLAPFNPRPARVARGPRNEAELIGRTDLGEQIPIGYNLSVIPGDEPACSTRDDSGDTEASPIGHCGKIMLFQDLTEIKQLEQRARQTDRLRAVGEMAAGIAHEIRNPLASIAGSIELLADSAELDETGERLLHIISSESDRLNHIIEQFLSYAREREPLLAPHNMRTIVEEIVTLFSNDARAAHITRIELHAPSEPLFVMADVEQLRQVVFNLLRNATEAMPQGGRIDITIETDGPDADELCVRVRDTGCGIPAEVLDQVFEPFYSTKRRGTGIGLALAEKIVRAHHGTISVESEPGRGTEFIIVLPRVNPAQARLEISA
ncbi:MAG: PAS domain-containing protein [Verrucomicrobia bacterium]|nr:PAS domain-containing protein [Verrucomicrobiota bacterium]